MMAPPDDGESGDMSLQGATTDRCPRGLRTLAAAGATRRAASRPGLMPSLGPPVDRVPAHPRPPDRHAPRPQRHVTSHASRHGGCCGTRPRLAGSPMCRVGRQRGTPLGRARRPARPSGSRGPGEEA
ncbi:hypothetical protein TOK_0688 [Pseudonocardia sp. N23]|nr:hypothetical protein TOK_0688 [Pseudonocardia sp. N23]